MEEKIIEILKEVLEEEQINSSSNQDNTEGWDSISQLMIVSELEATYGVSFEPEEISKMKSVSDISQILASK